MSSLTRGQRNLILLMATAALLMGCANDEKVIVWTKPNVSDDQRYKDLSLCKRFADQQMAGDRGLQQDMQVMNGGMSSGIKPNLGQNIGAYSDSKRYDALLRDCMTEAGYQAVK